MGNIGVPLFRGRYSGSEEALDTAFAKKDAAALKAAKELDPAKPGVHVDEAGNVTVKSTAGRKAGIGTAVAVAGALAAPEVFLGDE